MQISDTNTVEICQKEENGMEDRKKKRGWRAQSKKKNCG